MALSVRPRCGCWHNVVGGARAEAEAAGVQRGEGVGGPTGGATRAAPPCPRAPEAQLQPPPL